MKPENCQHCKYYTKDTCNLGGFPYPIEFTERCDLGKDEKR